MTEEKGKNIRNEVYEWLKSIALAIIIAVLIKTFLFNTTYVLGYSMYPTLHERDRLLTNKILYLFGEPHRGDIVVLKAPDDPNKDYIKRVIAVEGDAIEIKDGKVFVNSEPLNEKYLPEQSYTYDDVSMVVPEDNVFVLGDNRGRGASKDSRYLGPIPEKLLKGKAIFRYYPFNNRFGSLYKE